MLGFWESEILFLDGDHYFDSLIRDIDTARESITVEMYIFHHDILGELVAHKLIDAHHRGVKVQIMVDGIGSHNFFTKLDGLFLKNNIVVRLYNPLPFLHPYYGKLGFKRRIQLFALRFWRLNRRNHRKIVTIDDRVMYTGSFNITAEHTHHFKEKKWKDTGVRVTGPNVQFAVLHFKKMWRLRDYYRYKKQVGKNLARGWKHSPLRLNNTVIMRRYYHRDRQTRLKLAEKRIWFMSPYFIPSGRFIKLLGKAAKRGVDVRLLISSETDVWFMRPLQYFYYPYLIKKGVRIFQYRQSVLHAKTTIIDNWMTVGSSNLNHRSILHDLEVDLVIQEEENRQALEQDFLKSTPAEQEITALHLKQRGPFDRLLSQLFFLFKYWF